MGYGGGFREEWERYKRLQEGEYQYICQHEYFFVNYTMHSTQLAKNIIFNFMKNISTEKKLNCVLSINISFCLQGTTKRTRFCISEKTMQKADSGYCLVKGMDKNELSKMDSQDQACKLQECPGKLHNTWLLWGNPQNWPFMDDLKKKFLKVTGTIDIKCLYTHTHLQGGPKKNQGSLLTWPKLLWYPSEREKVGVFRKRETCNKKWWR